MKLKCAAQEHNTMSPARSRPQTAHSRSSTLTMRPHQVKPCNRLASHPELSRNTSSHVLIPWKLEISAAVSLSLSITCLPNLYEFIIYSMLCTSLLLGCTCDQTLLHMVHEYPTILFDFLYLSTLEQPEKEVITHCEIGIGLITITKSVL